PSSLCGSGYGWRRLITRAIISPPPRVSLCRSVWFRLRLRFAHRPGPHPPYMHFREAAKLTKNPFPLFEMTHFFRGREVPAPHPRSRHLPPRSSSPTPRSYGYDSFPPPHSAVDRPPAGPGCRRVAPPDIPSPPAGGDVAAVAYHPIWCTRAPCAA